MGEAILATSLTKWYPKADRPAIDDLTFAVEPTEVVGLLGPNGAGKSTLVRMICGVTRPTSGSISVLGFDPMKSPVAAKSQTAAMHQGAALDMMLPCLDSLHIAARFRGISWREVRPWVDELTEFLGLREQLGQLTFQLSGGQKQRLQLARALLAIPQLLILDEPSAALDVAGRRQIWDLVAWLREKYHVTVLWASHNIAEIERNCDRALVIDRGKLVRFDRPRDLIDEFGTAHVLVTTLDERLAGQIAAWAGSAGDLPERVGADVRIRPGAARNAYDIIPSLTQYCHDADIAMTRLSVETDSLEDVFIRLTHGEEQTHVAA